MFCLGFQFFIAVTQLLASIALISGNCVSLIQVLRFVLDECLLGQMFLRVITRTLVWACFIEGVRGKSLSIKGVGGGGV